MPIPLSAARLQPRLCRFQEPATDEDDSWEWAVQHFLQVYASQIRAHSCSAQAVLSQVIAAWTATLLGPGVFRGLFRISL